MIAGPIKPVGLQGYLAHKKTLPRVMVEAVTSAGQIWEISFESVRARILGVDAGMA